MCDPVTATYVTLAATAGTTLISIQAQRASMKMLPMALKFMV